MLSRQGHEVTVATNTSAALVRLTNDEFDLLLLDMNMPDTPGIKIIEFVREDVRLKRIPILVVTANHLWLEKVKNFGIKQFLVKPVPLQDLAAAVDKVLKSS
jgi:CheY-like chemotaxis protein